MRSNMQNDEPSCRRGSIGEGRPLENVFDVLRERGFVEQTTGDEAISHLLKEPTTCYIGFDPTASSFHVGSLVPIMALAHVQRHGHRPIALVGGGTALVGDPSGKTEMRQMLTPDQVNQNAEALKKQLSRFLDFQEGRALLLNNAQWLRPLQYISFLRDIGRHFSVNRMIKAESCKMRLESEEGLNFIEFNYMLLQAYDFLEVFDKYGVEYKGKMAVCPFHVDTQGSLSFTNKNGLWKCWGCSDKGDIISMIKKLEDLKNDNKKRG